MSTCQEIEWGWIRHDLEQELEALYEEDEVAVTESEDRAKRIAEIESELETWTDVR